MSKPFPPRRWGIGTPVVEGWYWFVGKVNGQWKYKFDEPVPVRVCPDARVPLLGHVWHEHEYGEFRKSRMVDIDGRWWGPVRSPSGWER